MIVIVTDAKYRASLAAVRSFSEAGYEVVLTQTTKDTGENIPSFYSRYVKRTFLLDCSVNDTEDYISALESIARVLQNPIIFPIGAKTAELLAKNSEYFSQFCKFVAPTPEALDFANDKSLVLNLAKNIGINIPKTFAEGEIPTEFPVIVKPKCGEKFGLTAALRYKFAYDKDEFQNAYEQMLPYGGEPVVQEKIEGFGIGVSLLMHNKEAVSAICHRRIREFPQSGGPSACCESFYDEILVRQSERLLAEIGYEGMAMVEYKVKPADDGKVHAENAYILEINPRVWGSFPLTYIAASSYCKDYAALALGEVPNHELSNYNQGVRMNFILSDLAACADLLRHAKFGEAFSGFCDIITRRAIDAIRLRGDNKPYHKYLKLKILKK